MNFTIILHKQGTFIVKKPLYYYCKVERTNLLLFLVARLPCRRGGAQTNLSGAMDVRIGYALATLYSPYVYLPTMCLPISYFLY